MEKKISDRKFLLCQWKYEDENHFELMVMAIRALDLSTKK